MLRQDQTLMCLCAGNDGDDTVSHFDCTCARINCAQILLQTLLSAAQLAAVIVSDMPILFGCPICSNCLRQILCRFCSPTCPGALSRKRYATFCDCRILGQTLPLLSLAAFLRIHIWPRSRALKLQRASWMHLV